ncbi:hypothetical protein C1645_767632 [Glomus cerebriforme]|uniref:Uncharacterized protein n=1 Tax=Glomus cerebriforme TaxID=658196 RepID=A0A397T382_9GLOM|nr:hypothetical protein C1645_767632 [Glomus cerebriforme]
MKELPVQIGLQMIVQILMSLIYLLMLDLNIGLFLKIQIHNVELLLFNMAFITLILIKKN